jgi:hypothetical protein
MNIVKSARGWAQDVAVVAKQVSGLHLKWILGHPEVREGEQWLVLYEDVKAPGLLGLFGERKKQYLFILVAVGEGTLFPETVQRHTFPNYTLFAYRNDLDKAAKLAAYIEKETSRTVEVVLDRNLEAEIHKFDLIVENSGEYQITATHSHCPFSLG